MDRSRSRKPSRRDYRAIGAIREMKSTVRQVAPDRCEFAGKTSYRSPASAAGALDRIRSIAEPGTRIPVRSYQCSSCNMWHLTSQPLRGSAEQASRVATPMANPLTVHRRVQQSNATPSTPVNPLTLHQSARRSA